MIRFYSSSSIQISLFVATMKPADIIADRRGFEGERWVIFTFCILSDLCAGLAENTRGSEKHSAPETL